MITHNAGKTAFLCKLMGIDFETREVTLRAWNSMPAISSGFYVIVSQAEWLELREDRAASCDTHPKDGDVEQAPLVSGAVGNAETPNA